MIRNVLERDAGILNAQNCRCGVGLIEGLVHKSESQQKCDKPLRPDIKVKLRQGGLHSYRDIALQISAKGKQLTDSERPTLLVNRLKHPEECALDLVAVKKLSSDISEAQEKSVRVKGSWGNGELKTESGLTGKYKTLEGGQIEFSLGPLRGYVLPNSKGVAYNPKTGQSFSFDFKYDQTSFKMANVKELESAGSQSGEPTWSGEIKGRVAHFDRFKLVMGANGKVMLLGGPVATGDTAKSRALKGEGFIDKNGNLIVAFENGQTFRADYTTQDGKLSIYKYELLE